MFHWLEKNPFFLAVGIFVVISFAGIIEIIPNFAQASRPIEGLKPYTPLEIAGRQVYIKESCNSCHSQLVRPFKSETDRYGKYSLSGEYAYDRPFLWGSLRTGPDLHRVGNYRTTDWHENHMKNPGLIVPGSTMPKYTWLFTKNADLDTAYAEAYTVKAVFNVPYDQPNGVALGDRENAQKLMMAQAKEVVADMKDKDVKEAFEKGEVKEIVALIAYLNKLK
jgi:cytochrome c oxidase cbb3-type subunit II